MNDKIYPTLPDNPPPDFYELYEALEWWELECTCKPGLANEICPSCKRYFEQKYDGAIPFFVNGKEIVE